MNGSTYNLGVVGRRSVGRSVGPINKEKRTCTSLMSKAWFLRIMAFLPWNPGQCDTFSAPAIFSLLFGTKKEHFVEHRTGNKTLKDRIFVLILNEEDMNDILIGKLCRGWRI